MISIKQASNATRNSTAYMGAFTRTKRASTWQTQFAWCSESLHKRDYRPPRTPSARIRTCMAPSYSKWVFWLPGYYNPHGNTPGAVYWRLLENWRRVWSPPLRSRDYEAVIVSNKLIATCMFANRLVMAIHNFPVRFNVYLPSQNISEGFHNIIGVLASTLPCARDNNNWLEGTINWLQDLAPGRLWVLFELEVSLKRTKHGWWAVQN